MKARSVFVAILIVAALFVVFGLVKSIGTATAQTKVSAPKQMPMSSNDMDFTTYQQLFDRMRRGEVLTTAEKIRFNTLGGRFGHLGRQATHLDNTGGPDAFSYYFVDNVIPDTATYSWIELDGAAGAVWLPASAFTNPDDGTSIQKYPLGFSFPFYGETYDSARLDVNGHFEFAGTWGSQVNQCLPSANVNAPMVAPFWDDLHLQNGGIASGNNVIGYKQFTGYTVIEWDSIGFWNQTTGSCSFEAVLFANGSIKFQYRMLNVPAAYDTSHTIGIQDSGAVTSPALNYVCGALGNQPAAGRAIWFFRPTGIPRPVTNLHANASVTTVTLTWNDPTTDTYGTPITLTNVQVWLGPVGTGTLVGTVPAGAQTFVHNNAPSGNLTYNVRPYHNPYYGAPTSVDILVGSPSYVQSFDTTNGGWVRTPAAGGWEWGTPLVPPGPEPHSGDKLWGTVLGGYYIRNACWQLDLALNRVVISPTATFEFWCWYNTYSFYDGCNFKVSTDGGTTWTVVDPQDGYPTPALYTGTACIGGQPAWSGINESWTNVIIPIGQFVGQTPIFRFDFGSSSFSQTSAGFYFDDVIVWGLQAPDGVPRAPTNLAAVYHSAQNNVVLTWTDPTLDLIGNPITPDSVQIWLGPAVSGQYVGSVLAGAQTFTHNNPPYGSHQTYTVRAHAAPNFGAPASVSLTVGAPIYVNNFDSDNGQWSSPGGGWFWGNPSNPSAPAPHSPPNEWGTGMFSNYPDNACWQVDMNLGLTVQSPGATLEFWYRYYCENSYDGCNVKASTDGGSTFTVLTPSQGAYTITALSTANSCMGSQPAWSGFDQTDWQHAVIPIGQFVGQAPILRLEFSSDPSVSGYFGFFFDDMTIWGLTPPQTGTVAGTISLSGGTGVVTNALVSANGIGAPSVHPLANGTYSLAGVQTGNRILTTTLAGYDTARMNITLTTGGLTNQNMTIRRLPPPAPTGLVSVLNSISGRDSLHWDVSTDLLVDGYRLYNKMRDSTVWHLRSTVYGRTTGNWAIDNLTQAGVWVFAVTAIDTGVIGGAATPVESPRSAQTPPQVFGNLPPVALTANGNFDNKIVLNWLAPGSIPEREAFYDDSTNEIGGLGWSPGAPTWGWMASHFQGQGPITVTRLKYFWTAQAVAGSTADIAVFADSGNGLPTRTPLNVMTVTRAAADTGHFVEYDITDQEFPTGSFFLGARQTGDAFSAYLGLGGDMTTPFRNNTFYYNSDGTVWSPFEPNLEIIPMMRCYAVGNMGQQVELLATEPGRGPIAPRMVASAEAAGWVTSNISSVASPASAAHTSAATSRDKQSLKKSTEALFVDSATPQGRHHDRFGRNVTGPVPPNVTASGHRSGRNPLDVVTKYIIFRDGARRDSVLGTILTYNDTPLPENQTHQYYVEAQYDNVNLSGPSNVVSMACNMAPAAPGNVNATAVGMTQARISWTAPTTNADGTPCVDLAGFRIYRDGTQIGTTTVGTNQYTDTPPVPTTFYTWSVKALDEVPNLSAAGSVVFAVQSPWRQIPMDWVDISTTGIATGLTDDDAAAGPFALGFSFPFYGGSYTQVYANSNGYLSFQPTTVGNFTNECIPTNNPPNCALYPFWDDLYPPSGGEIKYYADAANQRFIMAWIGVPLIIDDTDLQTFEVIISANGSVTYNYQTIGDNTSMTAGVENCTGSDAIQIYCDGDGPFPPTSNTAVEFWGGPTSGVQGIVRAFSPSIPIQGASVYLVGQQDTVTTDEGGSYTFGAPAGTYSVHFSHPQYCDTSYAGVVVLDGEFTTRAATMKQPTATFSVSSINKFMVTGQVVTDSFYVRNNGGQCPLNFSVTDSALWLSELPISGTVNPNVNAYIHYTIGPITQTGIYQSSIMVNYNAPGQPTRIPVQVQIADAVTDQNPALPTVFALHPNYPNPFNATTAVRFDVPRDSRVDIVIYNLMGQEVAHPVRATYPAGRHQVIYDATNLPSGTYVVRMTAGDFSQLTKMMLLK